MSDLNFALFLFCGWQRWFVCRCHNRQLQLINMELYTNEQCVIIVPNNLENIEIFGKTVERFGHMVS